jgi:uncharacterized membrane protein YtjA (UPF0391 family)
MTLLDYGMSGAWSVPLLSGDKNMETKGKAMLRYAVVFLVIALIAALIGFTGIAAGAVEIAKILFLIFVLLFVVSLVFGLMRPR